MPKLGMRSTSSNRNEYWPRKSSTWWPESRSRSTRKEIKPFSIYFHQKQYIKENDICMHVEIRKIQITGGSSFMVTLPKEWASSNGLKKNDPVRLEPQDDGSLIIYAGEVPEREQEVKIIKAHSNTALLY